MPFQQFCSGTLITKLCCFLTTNDLPVANPKAFQCEASGSSVSLDTFFLPLPCQQFFPTKALFSLFFL